jgi:hypothetical protein
MAQGIEQAHGELENAAAVGDLVWRALRAGGSIARRRDGEPWQFATRTAEVKVDGALLNPLHRGMILGRVATYPCTRWADLWVPAPNGVNEDVELLGEMYEDQEVSMWVRPNRDDIYHFEPVDGRQVDKVRQACRLMIDEDVSTTGSTVYHLAQTLRRINPGLEIHSLSWLQRSPIRPEYTRGPDAVVYHTLCRMDVPTEHNAFVEKFGFEPELV